MGSSKSCNLPKKKSGLRTRFSVFRLFALNMLRRLVRRTWIISRKYNLLRKDVQKLKVRVSSLQSQVNQLRAQVNGLSEPYSALRNTLQARVGRVVVLETNAGPVSGTLITVGTNYAEIAEPTGDLVFVRLEQINYIA